MSERRWPRRPWRRRNMPDERERPDDHGSREQPPDIRRLGGLFGSRFGAPEVALTGIFVLFFFYTLYFARSLFLPIVLAMLLNFLLGPAVRGFKRLRIPEAIGAGIVILGLLAAVSLGVYRLSGPAAGWIERTPEGLERVERRIRQLRQPVEEVREAAEQVEREVE